MIHLTLAILSSAMITVFMRLSEGKSGSETGMLTMNYLACFCLSLLHAGADSLLITGEGRSAVLLLGVISGGMYLAAFLLLKWNVSRNGVVLPATFMKLGVLVPTLMAVVVFGEKIKWPQLPGFALALAAILLLQGKTDGKAKSVWGLVLLLLTGGLADGMSKIFEETCPSAFKNQFLLYTFLVALALSACVTLKNRRALNRYDIAFGLLIGVPNYYSSRFLLLSLSEISAVVAYPCFSIGTIVVVAAFGALLFGEKLEKRKLLALSMILASLVLLNI